jgi:hypothetical protein
LKNKITTTLITIINIPQSFKVSNSSKTIGRKCNLTHLPPDKNAVNGSTGNRKRGVRE